eukprot:NODE_1041_length_1818_cov_2.579407.p4 type:complete len:111 gc:universal NODE_1041_length_1818_cov_2.579407:747-415(-)
MSGNVSKVVATYRDRLCRFGFEMFKHVCDHFHTSLVVLNQQDQDQSEELKDDHIVVCTYLTTKAYMRRSGSKRHQASQDKISKAKIIKETKENDEKMDGNCTMDLQSMCI